MSATAGVLHPFPPLFDENSRTLILGSFPSVKSREQCFFYGHPQNRFWKLTAMLFDEEVPQSIEEKKRLIIRHNLALWDVVHSCTITGSSDSSIKNVVANDLSPILNGSRVDRIFTNGALAHKLYMKHIFPQTGIEAVKLPSTSPANASYSLDRLSEYWKIIILPPNNK